MDGFILITMRDVEAEHMMKAVFYLNHKTR